MSVTTPTGIPVTDCNTCRHRHPVQRPRCADCGLASAFINPDGVCLTCVGGERA